MFIGPKLPPFNRISSDPECLRRASGLSDGLLGSSTSSAPPILLADLSGYRAYDQAQARFRREPGPWAFSRHVLPLRTSGVLAVAVGTTIAGRPPHRSVRARLRIRLLPRMNSVEALIGIRMQNTRLRNPPVQQWVETIPSHLRALTATD